MGNLRCCFLRVVPITCFVVGCALKMKKKRLFSSLVSKATFLKCKLGNLSQHEPRTLSCRKLANVSFSVADPPVISIVTPSFNQSRYIRSTMDSVIDQKYPCLEYFVQDGESSDGTIDIIREYEGRISGWESRADSGQSDAINRAFAKTSGEVMGWLNSDDLILPGALSCVAKYFWENPNVDVVYGHRLLIDEDGSLIGRWIMPDHDDNILNWSDYVPQETMFWRRSIWEKSGGELDRSLRFAMDWDLILRFREAGAKFNRIPRLLGGFRVHSGQKTAQYIDTLGHSEMTDLRNRALGFNPSKREIYLASRRFLYRHVLADLLWGITHNYADYYD